MFDLPVTMPPNFVHSSKCNKKFMKCKNSPHNKIHVTNGKEHRKCIEADRERCQ